MKNSRPNIKINPPEPSSEQIRQHMDFDKVLTGFEAAPSSPSGWTAAKVRYLGIGAFVTGIAVIALLFVMPNLFLNNEHNFEPAAYVNPPFEGIQKQFTNFQLAADQGGIFKYGDSRLTVPPSAFVHKDGSPVAGEVTLKYKEYHDYIDFFLSGIPMEYDSAGTEYLFESAGMMEILAFKGAEEIFLAPNKDIDVQLAATLTFGDEVPAYNIYQLDTTNRSWTYKTTDRIDVVAEESFAGEEEAASPQEKEQQQLSKEIKTLESKVTAVKQTVAQTIPVPPRPVAPQAADENDHVLNFELDLSEFPEMAAYDKVIWKLNEQYKPGWFQVEWEDIKLKKLSGNTFNAILSREDQEVKINISPVLAGKDLAKALADFESKEAAYNVALEEREAKVAAEAAKRAAELEERLNLLAAQKMELDKQIAYFKKKGMNRQLTEQLTEKRVVNNFKVTGLGTWNCDRPLPPYMFVINNATFKDKKQTFKGNKVFLANTSRNTVGSTVLNGNRDQINFDERSDNIMWLVTQEGKLAIFEPERFKKVKASKEYTFVMNTTEHAVDSEEEIRELLRL